ncbi:MAG: AI-2E family transporter [Candidatus Saccharimonadales bacterium]
MKLFTKRAGVTINLSTEAVIRTIVLVIAALIFIKIFGRVGYQLQLIGISAFLALALNPAVTSLSKRLHIKSRIGATGLAYVVVITLLVAFVALVVPPLVRQTNDFVRTVPDTIKDLKNEDTTVGKFVKRYNLQSQIDKVSGDLSDKAGDAPSLVLSTAGRVGGAFIAMITIFVLTFMMLVEGPLWLDRFFSIMPSEKRKPYRDLARKMYKVVTGYVNGQVLIAAIAAAFAFTALTIAGHFTSGSTVNPAALAGIVFLFGLIPLIGNTLAAIVVVIICLFSSVPLAIIMAIYFPVYQQIENATLQPLIQAKSNQLTPLLVFVAALLGAGFGGLLGAFVAIPAAGCLRILFEYHFGDSLMPTHDSVDAMTNKK